MVNFGKQNDLYSCEQLENCYKLLCKNVNVLKKLTVQQDTGSLCDVVFNFDENLIYAHSCVLASCSLFFYRYFTSVESKISWSLTSPHAFRISDLDNSQRFAGIKCRDCFSSVIKFIYSGSINIIYGHENHVLKILSVLEMNDLLEIYKLGLPSSEFPESNSLSKENLSCVKKGNKDDSRMEYDIADVEKVEIENDCKLNKKSDHECSSNLENKNIRCVDCCQSFKSKSDFEDHKIVHHSRSYSCLHCNFQSNKLYSLIHHVEELRNHDDLKCSICLNNCNNLDILTAHIKSHFNVQPFSCTVCLSNFKKRSEWSQHLSAHFRISQFRCIMCTMFFESKALLRMHILNRHKVRRLECDSCSFSTRFPASLERHKLKHSAKTFLCNHPGCTFMSARKDNLVAHTRIHMDKANLSCSICGVTFSLAKNLKRHLKVHEKNCIIYNCPKCKYKNYRLDKLKHHCIKMHSDCDNILTDIALQVLERNNSAGNAVDLIMQNYGSKNCKSMKNPVLISNQEIQSGSVSPIVYLNESTGKLTVLCDQESKPLSGNLYTISNASGMSRVIFDKSGEVLSVESVSDAVDGGTVILSEKTGEFFYLDLKATERPLIVNPSESNGIETLLDEATGEICTKEKRVAENPDIQISDDVFDGVDFDAVNDDSFDGFDGFDEFIFDSSVNSRPPESDMNKILNEVTGELFSNQCCEERNSVDKKGGSFWNLVSTPFNEGFVNSEGGDSSLSGIFLNEVTGEFTFNNLPN